MKPYNVKYNGNSSKFRNLNEEINANSEREAVHQVFKARNGENYFEQPDGSVKDSDGQILASATDETIEYDGGYFYAEEKEYDLSEGNVIIEETGKQKNLAIIDPRTGIDYTSDFLGNNGTSTDEEGFYHMTEDDYNWWKDIIEKHQANDNRIVEIERNIEGGYGEYDEKLEAFRQELYQNSNADDLEYHVRAVAEFLDEYENREK
jgi:hypothetical protein